MTQRTVRIKSKGMGWEISSPTDTFPDNELHSFKTIGRFSKVERSRNKKKLFLVPKKDKVFDAFFYIWCSYGLETKEKKLEKLIDSSRNWYTDLQDF